MKKVYSAPDILFENFSMSTNIAGDCEAKAQTFASYSENGCGIDFGGYIVFAAGYNGCTDMQIEEYGEFGGICYHVPSDANNLFNS